MKKIIEECGRCGHSHEYDLLVKDECGKDLPLNYTETSQGRLTVAACLEENSGLGLGLFTNCSSA